MWGGGKGLSCKWERREEERGERGGEGGGRGEEGNGMEKRGEGGRGGEGMVDVKKEGGIREREEREIEDNSRINHLLLVICYLIFIASHIQLEK